MDGRKVQKLILEKDNEAIILYLYDTDKAYFIPDWKILLFDVTNEQSFEEIKKYYYDKIKNKINLIYLLGNKIDLKKNIQIKEKDVKKFASENGIKYFLISVKNDINIQKFFNNLKINIEKIENNINNGIKEIIYGNPSKECYKIIFFSREWGGLKNITYK